MEPPTRNCPPLWITKKLRVERQVWVYNGRLRMFHVQHSRVFSITQCQSERKKDARKAEQPHTEESSITTISDNAVDVDGLSQFDACIVADGSAVCESCWKTKACAEFPLSASQPRGTYPWCTNCVRVAGDERRDLPIPIYNCEQPITPNPLFSGEQAAALMAA